MVVVSCPFLVGPLAGGPSVASPSAVSVPSWVEADGDVCASAVGGGMMVEGVEGDDIAGDWSHYLVEVVVVEPLKV